MLIKSQIEVKLKSVPEDAISAVKFAPNTSQFLLAGSWDSTLRLYDIVSNSLKSTFVLKSPVLDIAFQVINYDFIDRII